MFFIEFLTSQLSVFFEIFLFFIEVMDVQKFPGP